MVNLQEADAIARWLYEGAPYPDLDPEIDRAVREQDPEILNEMGYQWVLDSARTDDERKMVRDKMLQHRASLVARWG